MELSLGNSGYEADVKQIRCYVRKWLCADWKTPRPSNDKEEVRVHRTADKLHWIALLPTVHGIPVHQRWTPKEMRLHLRHLGGHGKNLTLESEENGGSVQRNTACVGLMDRTSSKFDRQRSARNAQIRPDVPIPIAECRSDDDWKAVTKQNKKIPS